MAPNVSLDVVGRYLDALRTGDLDSVPFADDVSFESPLAARISGRAGVVDALRGMLPVIEGLTVRDHIVDGVKPHESTGRELGVNAGMFPAQRTDADHRDSHSGIVRRGSSVVGGGHGASVPPATDP